MYMIQGSAAMLPWQIHNYVCHIPKGEALKESKRRQRIPNKNVITRQNTLQFQSTPAGNKSLPETPHHHLLPAARLMGVQQKMVFGYLQEAVHTQSTSGSPYWNCTAPSPTPSCLPAPAGSGGTIVWVCALVGLVEGSQLGVVWDEVALHIRLRMWAEKIWGLNELHL